MNRKHLFKKVIVFMIVLIGTLTLSACKEKELKIPYGSLDDTVFLSGDGYKVTKKELYEEMRISEFSTIEKLIYQIVMKDEIALINDNREDYQDDFVEIVNDNIFYTDDMKELKELEDEDLKSFVARFVDLLYLDGVDINPTDIDTVNFTDHSEVIFDYFVLDVAKRNFARKLLKEDVVDKDSDYFIDIETDIENYFKNQVQKRYPLSSINIRFTNSYEANQTLRHFNLKTFRSQWYAIADPRVEVVTGYPLEVLQSLDLEGKNGELSESEHQLYYDKYTINPTREPTEDADVSLSLDEVLGKFFDIYNFVYPYKTKIDTSLFPTVEDVLNSEDLVNDDEENLGQFTMLYDDYPSAQSSLRTYIYNTLYTDEDGTRYTASPRSYGNHYFITFKLKDHNEDLLDYLDEDDEFILYENEEEKTLTTYAQEFYDKIVKDKLTNTYINKKFEEKLEEAKVVVYDEIIYLNLENRDLDVELAKKSSKDVVIKVDETEILVDELYELLEKKIGATIAMDLAVKNYLMNSPYRDKITDKMMEQYKENIENVIRQFSQNAFESSGFPASMGRKNFLRLSFRSETIDEAITKVYVHNELERLFYNDYERLYGEQIYEIFADYANRVKDQYFAISSSHLLVYIDMDEDGEPDNPEDFFETLSEAQVLEYQDMVTEIMQIAHDRASKHSQFKDGLRSIVNDFNNSSKFRSDLCDAEEGIEYRPECTWAKYKQYGFLLKFEDLGETQNSTNYPTSGSGLHEDFFNRLHTLYDEVKEEYYDVDEKFPSQVLDARPTAYASTEDNKGVLETSFGWHLILVTGGKVSQSSKFTYEDDTYVDSDKEDRLKIYEEITVKDREDKEIIINAYSDDEYISVNQARIFLYESQTDRGVVSLPQKVLNTLNAYLKPVKQKYEGDYMKMHLLYKLFSELDYEFSNPNSKQKLEGVLEINERQFLNYSDKEDLYNDLYGNWFDVFK